MPRRTRAYEETEASKKLDNVVTRYDKVEKQLAELGVELKAAVVELAREALSTEAKPGGPAKLTMAEIGRRVGWTREYVSRVVTDANKRDGWTPPKVD